MTYIIFTFDSPERLISLHSDNLPTPPNLIIQHYTENILRDLSVDTMLLSGDEVLWLRIGGSDCGPDSLFVERSDQSPSMFDAAGHYPILAGFNQCGEALYVAAVEMGGIYYFTSVEDGAWTVTYADEEGNEYRTKEFLVLALRHDPSDATPPYPRTCTGAMDPTGPLHWLKFWPEKDPDFVAASISARDDDNHLESLLNSFDGNSSTDRDIWWWN